jgi:hypothetical protein
VTFSTEEALVKYFAWTRDNLIAVSDGWDNLLEHFRDFERKAKSKPDWERWWEHMSDYVEPEIYDFMKDELL